MSTAIIVGGGVAGLLAAKLLVRRYHRVFLIERENYCGGLLASVTNDDGVAFDCGAHVLTETGSSEIDAELFGDLSESEWNIFNILRAGNWFGGAMNRTSPFPDARTMGAETLRTALSEVAEIFDHEPGTSKNFADVLRQRFGETLALRVAGPVVRKQLGVDPENLHPLTPFGIRRIICADAEESRQLKALPQFSEPLAFASYDEGIGEMRHHYPRNGGVGKWVNGFVEKLRKDGVEIICGTSIASINHFHGRIASVTLDDGCILDCDLLVWSLSSAALLHCAAIPFEGKPIFSRPIGLYHLVFDRPFADENYHVTCYDESFSIFRVTLYPGLRGDAMQAPFNCTVEVIGDKETNFQNLMPKINKELLAMNIVAAEARLLSSMVHVLPTGFPATTHEFMAASEIQSRLAQDLLKNSILVGRACSPPFFTSDVLLDVHQKISTYVDE